MALEGTDRLSQLQRTRRKGRQADDPGRREPEGDRPRRRQDAVAPGGDGGRRPHGGPPPARSADDEAAFELAAYLSRKSSTMGTTTSSLSISVTCVVSGRIASLDSERGRMSPKISSPFRRNISAMWSRRTPSASPWTKRMGAFVALRAPAPKSYGLTSIWMTRFTNVSNLSGVGLSFLYSVSMGEPLNMPGSMRGNISTASLTQPSWRNTAEMLTTLR